MKKAGILFILVYYSIGTFFLPAGNFHTLMDIPEMYKHCKQTEHCDMNVLEFFTDHLMNIDGMLDNHDKGDDQKQHTPFNFQAQQDMAFLPTVQLKMNFENHLSSDLKKFYYKDEFYQSSYNSEVFRPPIV